MYCKTSFKEVGSGFEEVNLDKRTVEIERFERHYRILDLLKKKDKTGLVSVPALYGVLTYKKQDILTNEHVPGLRSYLLMEKVPDSIDYGEVSRMTKSYVDFLAAQNLGPKLNYEIFYEKAHMKYERAVAFLHDFSESPGVGSERGFLDDLLPKNFLIQVEKDSDGKAKLRGWLIDQ